MNPMTPRPSWGNGCAITKLIRTNFGQVPTDEFTTLQNQSEGGINWLFDVVSPDRATAGRVIASFRQVVKEGDLRLHPQVVGLVGPEMLENMGVSQTKGAS